MDGRLRVFAEESGGVRREVVGAGTRLGEPIEAPPGARKLAAVLTGRDTGGRFVATAEVVIE
jgi:hypothetical protein